MRQLNEAEFIDAKTNQTMTKVPEVFGSRQLENEQITTKDFKAAIDKLNTDLWTFIHS
ncbi:hypothetical protein [Pseudomonas sp. QTF5]|uniref:hypothetical protein n=1 Tax=Pseudomonas sp. QTF5 TaxID=1435425 RepID=UPI0004AE40C3